MIYTRPKFPSAQNVLGILLSIVLVCVSAGPSTADEELQDGKPVFFPLPPDIPRLQFLKKFSSALDVTTTKKGFRDFVFGGEENEGQLIQKPYGVAIYEGAIYIVDTRGNGFGVFDLANSRARFVHPSFREGTWRSRAIQSSRCRNFRGSSIRYRHYAPPGPRSRQAFG